MDTITIVDPSYPWDQVAPMLIAVLVGVVLSIVALSITSTRKSKAAENVWAVVHTSIIGLTLAVGFITAVVAVVAGTAYYSNQVQWAKIDALEELGYAEADIEDDGSFVANRNGDYFTGILVPIDDNTWQIVERGENK